MAGCPLAALGLQSSLLYQWVVGAVVILALAALGRKIRKPSNPGLALPPGSMGWPLLGETLDFMRSFSSSRTASTPSFMQARRKLHGDVYKTNVMGTNAVVIGGPEGQKFFASYDGRLLETPNTFRSVIDRFGSNALFLVNGDHHKRLRKAMLEPFGLGSLKARLPAVEWLTLDTLRKWEGKEILLMTESTKFTFSLILDMFLSLKPGPDVDYIWEQFQMLSDGGVSLPLKIPGTTYYKMLQARQFLVRYFQGVIDSRRNSDISKPESNGGDILDFLLNPSPGESVSDEEIVDNIIFVLFAGYDTTALALTSIIRRLFQNPDQWSLLQREHDRIRENLQGDSIEGRYLTWDSLKHMTYTMQIVYEVTRTSSIGETSGRNVLADLEFQGYRIPKGWMLFLDRDSANFDKRTFNEPEKFDPARFQDGLPSNFSWAPFGIGPHMCLGMELAKLELCVFTHHLVTAYTWKMLTDDFSLDYGRAMPRYRTGIPIIFERRMQAL